METAESPCERTTVGSGAEAALPAVQGRSYSSALSHPLRTPWPQWLNAIWFSLLCDCIWKITLFYKSPKGNYLMESKTITFLRCLGKKNEQQFLAWNSLRDGEGNGTPLQYSCLENPMDGGAWWAAIHGVATSRTRLSDFPFTFHFHPLEKDMATHSSVLAWRIPGMGEPGGLPSMGSHRVGHDWSDLAAAV